MGWTFHSPYNSPRTHKEERAEIERLFTPSQEFAASGGGYEVLQASKVGSTWYVAARVFGREDSGPYIADSDGSYVVGFVFLTRRSDGWGYKDMDECMGPRESKAPQSLLAKLSDLDPNHPRAEYALEWRKRCRAWIDSKPPKINDGDRIETHPITLQNGSTVKTFEVFSYRYRGKNRRAFRCLENDSIYTLNRPYLQGAKIIATAQQLGK